MYFLHLLYPSLTDFQRNAAFVPLGLDLHASRKRRDAGADVGDAVDHHEAGAAFADRAEETARPLHLRRNAVDVHPVRVQRHRYRLPFVSFELAPVEGKCHFPTVFVVQYRVILYQFHALSPSLVSMKI